MLKMNMTMASVCLMVAGAASAHAQDSTRIFQPGAPGEPSREITAEQSQALAQTRYIEADAQFMRHMIVHHAQAVEMVSLIEARSIDDSVQQLGLRISLSQEQEIAFMERWLTARGEPTVDENLHMSHGDMDHDGMNHDEMDHGEMTMSDDPSDVPIMPGMLSPAQMVELRASDGADFDRLFLEGMIQHHLGALYMVDTLRENPDAGEDPILSGFLNDIYADQSAEIIRMRRMLANMNS